MKVDTLVHLLYFIHDKVFNPALTAMVVIEQPNPRKRRRTIEPMTELPLPAAKKSRSSLSRHTKPNQNVGLDRPDRTSIYCSFKPQCRSHFVGKRGRATEDEEPTEHTRKSPRLQENR